jgi:hypothetical protein
LGGLHAILFMLFRMAYKYERCTIYALLFAPLFRLVLFIVESETVHGVRAVSAQTAVLFGERLCTSAEFWMNLQVAHDLEQAREEMGFYAQTLETFEVSPNRVFSGKLLDFGHGKLRPAG